MLAERPKGWEYLHFAGVLLAEKSALEGKFLDHELGYAAPTGERVDDQDAVTYLRRALDDIQSLVGSLTPQTARRLAQETARRLDFRFLCPPLVELQAISPRDGLLAIGWVEWGPSQIVHRDGVSDPVGSSRPLSCGTPFHRTRRPLRRADRRSAQTAAAASSRASTMARRRRWSNVRAGRFTVARSPVSWTEVVHPTLGIRGTASWSITPTSLP